MPRLKPDARDSDRTMQVVDHIRVLIENGSLQPGDKIPPEREFALSLGISRASLRTGIGHLAAMGVMKVRHGVGTFVADGPPEFSKVTLNLMGALHGFQSWQMFEARLVLEGSLAALAAARGREEHFVALSDQVEEMFACTDKPAEFLIHDVLFHRVVSQASGNPILAALMESTASAMYEDRRKTVKHANYLRKMAGMHRAIFRAIRARDPIEARTLMEDHLRAAQTAQNLEPQTGRKAAHGTPESCKITKASTKSQKQLPGQQLVS